ncbi:MAG: osmoprotectant transport system substrate-binding protein opuBD [Acidobacteriota bacterium]|jgi:osmoprotectant transport system permease protein|nr:osmoprotectant transport system substrate-binding protein opuBD [Acidobacteriota bacterium]
MSAFDFILRNWREILALTGEHLLLVAVSTLIAVAIGIPVGLLLTRRARWKRPVLAVANIFQTVPSLALFGFLIPLPLVGGIGARAAIVALVLYALLPVIRNTVTGIEGVDRNVREAAVAMGMTSGQILRQVELPLAAPVLLAGVRVATVISVGVATIAAAIGAGGLGTFIFRGLRQYDNKLILAGAIPAALLALVADAGIGLIESSLDVRRRVARKGRTGGVLVRRVALTALAVAVLSGGAFALWQRSARADLTIGSKDFTESVILAEIFAQTLEARGLRVERRYELGGNLTHDSLVAGKIDAYPEYTGTSLMAILKHPPATDARAVYEQVKGEYAARFDVEVGPPLGFEDTFAILVRADDARRLNLKTISDVLPQAPKWRAGFGQDFMSRADGYEGFARAYGLQFAARPREMDLSLSYRALADGQVDIIAGNSTDGMISTLGLTQLEDDRHYFPPYEAVILARRDTLERLPQAREVLQRLAGSISTEEMRRLNYEVDGHKRAAADVVREWRQSKGL